MPRNDDISLILVKAKRAGFFENVLPEELDFLKREADSVLGDDPLFNRSTAFSNVKDSLDRNKTCAIGFMGDSTGNEVSLAEWIHLFGIGLGQLYPDFTVKHPIWDDTTQALGAPNIIQTGPLGERSVRGTKTLITDASTVTHIAGDIDISVKVSLDDWTPAAQTAPVARFGGAGARAWRFFVSTSGLLTLEWSADGTALNTKQSTVANGIADGTVKWIRTTLDVDNGAAGNDVKFYTSDDGITWTQLGATVTTAGITSIFNPTTQPWEICGRGITGDLLNGQLYEVRIKNGIDGPIVCRTLPDLWEYRDDTSYTFTGSPVLTLVNGSHSGAGLAYLNDATRLPKLNPDYGQTSIVFSDSHNEQWRNGERFRVEYEAWLDAVKTLRPLATQVLSTQNPRKAPATFIEAHATRQQIVRTIAAKRGLSVIDAFKAFGTDLDLIGSDGIHTTKGAGTSGAQVWANRALTLFKGSI